MIERITIRRNDTTLMDDWQGDLAGYDLEETVRSYDETIRARVAAAFPRAEVALDRGLGAWIAVEPPEYEGAVGLEVEGIVIALGERPEEWIVRR